MNYQIKAMSFAEMLDTAFRIVRDHFTTLVALSAVVHVPIAFLNEPIRSSPDRLGLTGALMAMLVSLVAGPIVATALTHATGEIYLGRRAGFARSLRAAVSIIVPLSGTLLLWVLGVLVGILLLVIPGVYLYLAWVLTWPVMVLEHRFGTTALGRSRQLVRGNMLRAFGILVLGGIIVTVLGFALGIGLRVAPVPMLGTLAEGLAQSVGVAYSSVVLVLLYFDIRCRKEAFDIEHLARLVESTEPAAA